LAYEYFYNGGGVAVGDINNDGLPDLFFTANMRPNKLYLNLGHLKFKDITAEACPELEGRSKGWKTGVTMADVNGDGLLDIYVCYSGKVDDDTRRNQLFINKGITPSPSGEGRGEVKFEEEAKQYGLDDKSYSTQAAFFDYDNDGDLDMFLLNHSTKRSTIWSWLNTAAWWIVCQVINCTRMMDMVILKTYRQKQDCIRTR
jgi:hypothetical protein